MSKKRQLPQDSIQKVDESLSKSSEISSEVSSESMDTIEQLIQEKVEAEQFNKDILQGLFYVVKDVKKNNQVELRRMEERLEQIRKIQEMNQSRSNCIESLIMYYKK